MYLDANVIIFANFTVGPQGVRARKILEEINGGRKAITSVLTIDEVMWFITKNNLKSELRNTVSDIYGTKNLDVKEVPPLAPLRAVEFMERHNLKPRDAMHLATMTHFGEHEIASDDKDFDGIPNIKRIKV